MMQTTRSMFRELADEYAEATADLVEATRRQTEAFDNLIANVDALIKMPADDRMFLDIPHFLRQDPSITRAAEALVTQAVKSGALKLDTLGTYGEHDPAKMHNETVTVRVPKLPGEDGMMARIRATEREVMQADRDEAERAAAELSDRINSENAG